MGLPASTMATPMGRNGEDLEKVKEMLSIIEVEHPPVCVYRMGPFKGGARPDFLRSNFLLVGPLDMLYILPVS